MKFKELHNLVNQKSNNKQITIVVISNITLEPYFQLLIGKFFLDSQISVNVVYIDFAEILTGKFKKSAIKSDIIVVVPNFNCFYPDVYLCPNLSFNDVQELKKRNRQYEKDVFDASFKVKCFDYMVWL